MTSGKFGLVSCHAVAISLTMLGGSCYLVCVLIYLPLIIMPEGLELYIKGIISTTQNVSGFRDLRPKITSVASDAQSRCEEQLGAGYV